MLETFVALLTGHLLGDFVFQPDVMFRNKQRPLIMLLHVVIVTGITAILLGPITLPAAGAVATVAATHLAMDVIKTRWLGDQLWSFCVDQLFHLAVIFGLVALWPDTASQGLWGELPAPAQSFYYAALVLISGLTIAIPVGGVVIKKLVEPISPTGTGATLIKGMPNAGRYIGWLERGLTIIFVLNKQPEAVGFLLAAKSILRFRDVQDTDERHQAEYIIIGTFLSFGWGILVAIATRAALLHWIGNAP